MNRFYVVILILFSITTIQAQKVKKVAENEGFGKAKFKVLKSDLKTKHGAYKVRSYTFPYRKTVSGYYNNGERHGDWLEIYDTKKKFIKEQGKYNNGRKIGVWQYYTPDGMLIHEFDYDNNVMIQNKECGNENLSYKVEMYDEVTYEIMDCPPTRLGGLGMLKKDLVNEITKKSPFKLKKKGKTTVYLREKLSFYISEKGTVENIYYSGTRNKLELFDVIKEWLNSDENEWIPGIFNGEVVKSQIQVPMNITLYY